MDYSIFICFLGPLGPLVVALSVILIDQAGAHKHSFEHIEHNNNTLAL